MLTNVIRAVVVLGYIIVIHTHQIWLLLLLIAIQESMWSFYWPCKNGLLPLYVKKEHIVIANSLDSTTWSSMYILGSAIGGFFLAWFGMTLNYIIDSVTYLISLFFVWRLTNIPKIIPTPAEIEMEDDENEIANALADEDNNEQLVSSDTNGGIDIEVYSITKRPPWLQAVVDHFRSLKDGFLYLGRNKYLLALTMLKGTSSLVWGAVEFANILFSEDAGSYFGSLGQALGIVWAVSGVGSIIGPLLSGLIIGSNLKKIHWLISICYILRFFAMLLLAWSPNFIVILIATLLISVCGTTVWMFSSSLIQQVSAKKYLGRVSSCDITVYNFSMLCAYLLVGALFETFKLPIRACLLIFSGLALFGAIWTTVYFLCFTNPRELAARYKLFDDSRSNSHDVFTYSTESSNQIQLEDSESDIEM
jgi:MFS family permease